MSAAQDLLNDQQSFVTTLQSNSVTMQYNAINAIQAAKPSPVTPTTYTPPPPFDGGTPPEAPTFDPIELDLPEPPGDIGELVGISNPNGDNAPTFTETPPELEFGNTPNQLPEFSGTAPGIVTSFSFPEAPPQLSTIISAPEFLERTAPDAPTITSPEFSDVAPLNDAVAPKGLGEKLRSDYLGMSNTMLTEVNGRMDAYLHEINPQYHAQMGRIEAQLSKYKDGGTALDASVEDAIYARAQAKNDLEAKRVQDAAFADNAARGFTLPSGVMVSALARARQEAANNNAKAANEIAIAQAEMEQKNLQFAVSTSLELRKTAIASVLSYMQNVNSLNGMALDYAKGILSAVVQAYDIEVKSFSLKLEAYKASANVYEIKVRASAQVIEIYKGQIQALEALTNIDRAKIDIFKARIDSLRVYGDLYKTQVEIVVSKASLEKLKIELFQAQVQTYSTQVQAKTAEWQGYQARLAGEESKVKVFAAQVDVYNGRIAAYKAKTDGISEQIKSQAAKNNATLQAYVAKMNAYESEVKAKSAVANANIESQRQKLTSYQGQINFAVAKENMALEAYKANVEANATNAKTSATVQLENAKVGVTAMSAIAETYGEILKVYSGPASAAAAGMVALASINEDV